MLAPSLRGRWYEDMAVVLLRRQGFDVRPGAGRWGADLFVNGIPVEVKGSGLQKEGYQFLLFKVGRSLAIAERVVVLLCWAPTGPEVFIIPARVLRGLHKLSIPNQNAAAYAGRFARYRNNYQVLKGGRRAKISD